MALLLKLIAPVGALTLVVALLLVSARSGLFV
jgi:hypothetical protein